jgi:hypothetical protein
MLHKQFNTYYISDPMRITKKFAGSSCIGKQVFSGGDGGIDETKRKDIQEELKALEKSFMSKIDYQHKVNYPIQVAPYHHAGAGAPPFLGMHPLERGLGHGHPQHHHPPHFAPGQAHIQGYPPMFYGLPPPHHPHHPHHINHRIPHGSTTSESAASDSNSEAKFRMLRPGAAMPVPLPLHPGGMYPYPPMVLDVREVAQDEDTVSYPRARIHNPHFLLRHPSHHPSHHVPVLAQHPGNVGSLPLPVADGQIHPPLDNNLVAPYRPRQAHSSADLFGRKFPTTIEQMNFLSSENLRKKLAADNTMPSNGFHSGGRMGMGDAAKFCSAAAHAYSEEIQCDDLAKRKAESGSSASSTLQPFKQPSKQAAKSGSEVESEESVSGPELEVKQVDLEASDLLLNFFNAAGTTTTKKQKKDGSVSGSSGSGSTSNQGEQDGDDSMSNFSDAVDGDVSASVSGRSSSLSSDRSDNNSDIDYSSHDDIEHEGKSVSYSPHPAESEREKKGKRSAAESYHLAEGADTVADKPFAAKIPRLV